MPSVRAKVRLFAHPGNPDARAAAAVAAEARARAQREATRLKLHAGSVVPSGTGPGTVSVPEGDRDGHLRFAIRPAGDPATIDPGPVLANWAELRSRCTREARRRKTPCSVRRPLTVFLLSKADLERTVLSDPRISIYQCGRRDIAAGAIDKRVLAALAFLSRSGLAPTVTALRCGQSPMTATGAPSAAFAGDSVEISAINGTEIAGHQGAGSGPDVAIRTLLTLPGAFLPHAFFSLMRYPGVPSTHASPADWNVLRLEFSPPKNSLPTAPAGVGSGLRHAARAASAPVVELAPLDSTQWDALFNRIGSLPLPSVLRKPSSAAIPDPKRRG